MEIRPMRVEPITPIKPMNDKKKDNNSDAENVEPFEISYEGLKFEPVIVERDSVTEIA